MSSAADPDAADLAAEKKRLRAALLARRAAAHAADPEAGARLAARLADVALPEGAVVAGYWPLRDEIDPRPAMLALLGLGHPLCLPVIVGAGKPLAFRAWTPDARLQAAGFGTQVPGPEAEERVPSVLLVPLVGFDDEGFRLGYGGGFYDRTLAKLRAGGLQALAIGLAYAAQRAERLPRETTDERLDWIVTEAGARALAPAT
ncbi:5-formyltetrahydrofolate cyclo-ligase [Tistlia consotensis]|uniref:5-formyltetrahydrofolate cyclo-ligase n=1 Tax=Tistlia consotensis USBA 355 TaxID=560819 RepID=A0A1Y6BWU2_9PROT|nr:5-formyltetrahydrofolate cyclo-ligase [Tistlia consotensis]SMF32783.1 5-formyltetrahydrofolate cyclo-ligase [Tistlia consotensis USBA 355]SNR68969.1 5-formyltetrahydrofolate cyclo-ligase [Tistlia consotensis]